MSRNRFSQIHLSPFSTYMTRITRLFAQFCQFRVVLVSIRHDKRCVSCSGGESTVLEHQLGISVFMGCMCVFPPLQQHSTAGSICLPECQNIFTHTLLQLLSAFSMVKCSYIDHKCVYESQRTDRPGLSGLQYVCLTLALYVVGTQHYYYLAVWSLLILTIAT